jgi:hypothetical protein
MNGSNHFFRKPYFFKLFSMFFDAAGRRAARPHRNMARRTDAQSTMYRPLCQQGKLPRCSAC